MAPRATPVAFLSLLVAVAGMCASPGKVPPQQLEAAFSTWGKEQASQALLQKEINRLAHPDVPLWIVFEHVAQPAVIPGHAADVVKALHRETCRLHGLASEQQFRFVLNGKILPPKVAISESALANTEHLEVNVMPMEWPVRRCRLSNIVNAPSSNGISAIQARRNNVPRPKRIKRQGTAEVIMDPLTRTYPDP